MKVAINDKTVNVIELEKAKRAPQFRVLSKKAFVCSFYLRRDKLNFLCRNSEKNQWYDLYVYAKGLRICLCYGNSSKDTLNLGTFSTIIEKGLGFADPHTTVLKILMSLGIITWKMR